jgi:hypothetical protein
MPFQRPGNYFKTKGFAPEDLFDRRDAIFLFWNASTRIGRIDE